eukprot:5128887-Amphidinium_carterae.1
MLTLLGSVMLRLLFPDANLLPHGTESLAILTDGAKICTDPPQMLHLIHNFWHVIVSPPEDYVASSTIDYAVDLIDDCSLDSICLFSQSERCWVGPHHS